MSSPPFIRGMFASSATPLGGITYSVVYCGMSTDIVKDSIELRLRLRYSSASPFARKVRVVAAELGLSGRIELAVCDVWAPDSDIAADNPLGKVPALVTGDGTFIGSTLCCEYLDSLHAGPPLIPRETNARWR